MIRNYNMTKDAKVRSCSLSAAQTDGCYKALLYDANRDIVLESASVFIGVSTDCAAGGTEIELGDGTTSDYFCSITADTTTAATAGVVLAGTLSQTILTAGKALVLSQTASAEAGNWTAIVNYYTKDADRMAGGPRYEG